MTSAPQQAIILITGIQAAGKSTIAQILAERLPRSVHVRGDLFRRMVINGRADMTPDPSAEAVRQLRLRHRLTAAACDEYVREGFTVVAQDVILGDHLTEMVQLIQHRPPARRGARPAARGCRRPRSSPGQECLQPVDHRPSRQRPAHRDTPPWALARHLRPDP